MDKNKNIIPKATKVRRGINGFMYSACDKDGYFIGHFHKLADVRKHWLRQIRWGRITLIRELDKAPDMSQIEEAKYLLEKILRSYSKK